MLVYPGNIAAVAQHSVDVLDVPLVYNHSAVLWRLTALPRAAMGRGRTDANSVPVARKLGPDQAVAAALTRHSMSYDPRWREAAEKDHLAAPMKIK